MHHYFENILLLPDHATKLTTTANKTQTPANLTTNYTFTFSNTFFVLSRNTNISFHNYKLTNLSSTFDNVF